MGQIEALNRRGGKTTMQNPSEALFRELEQLEAIYTTLSESLAKAAEQFRQARIAPPSDLVAELANYERRLNDLAHRIREHGKSLSLSPAQLSNLSASSLDDIKYSLQSIAEIEDKNAKMAIKVKAVAALDRALCLVRRDRASSAPISRFQLTAQAIRESIVNSAAVELPPEARDLAEGKHVISRLLDLIERQENLTDDECLKLHETIAQSLGKELAVAALRGRLEVPSSTRFGAEQSQPVSSAEASEQKDSSVAEVSLRHGASEVEESASSSPHPVAQADLDAAVEKLLEHHFQEAGYQADLDGTVPGNPAACGAQSTAAQAASPKKQEAETTAAEAPVEEPSELQSAFDVGNAVMEAIRVEEVADRCLAEGRLPEAEEHYQQLLTLQKRLFDAKDPKVVRTTQNLATVERLQRRRRAEADKSQQEPIKTGGGYQGPVILASFQPTVEEGNSRRIGIAAVAILAIGVSVYAAMRYWPTAAEHAAAPPAVNAPVSSQPAPGSSLAEPPRLTDDPNFSEAPVPPPAAGAKLAAQLPLQRSGQLVPQSAIQPVLQSGAVSPRNLIVNSSAQRTLASTGRAQSGSATPNTALPVPPAPPQRVRAGGFVAIPKLVSKTTPVYPAAAKKSHVQGTVHLEALIDKNGFIANLTVISGPALLIKPAMDAVKEWRYQPTMLDGNLVEVETPVDVTFSPNQ